MTIRLDEPLSFPAAAEAIGWGSSAGRRLRRLVGRRERQTKREFAGRDSAGRITTITIGSLTRHCPELVQSRVDTLADHITPVLEMVGQRMQGLAIDAAKAEVAESVEPELQRLHNRDEKIAEKLGALADAVRALESNR